MLNNLNQVEQHDYTNNIFIGTVVYNDDPLKLRRVKVKIPNLYDSEDHTELPWVAPMFMGFVANIPGNSGSMNLVPGIGAEVVVELQMGSPLHGLYLASFLRPNSVLAEFNDNYLGKYGWKDPAGNIFIVDTTDGQDTIRMYHGASGAEFKIVNNGDTSYTTPGDITVVAGGNVDVTVAGTTTLNSDGRVTINTPSEVHVNGSSVIVTGGDVVADGISLKSHVHQEQGDGAPTSPPL